MLVDRTRVRSAALRLALTFFCAFGLAACQSAPVAYSPVPPSDRAADAIESYRESLAEKRELVDREQRSKRDALPDPVNLLAEGDKQRDAGELAAALFSYLQAYEADRSDTAPVERVALLHLRREPDRAQLIFEELIASEPGRSTLHSGLALTHLAQDELDPARKALFRAIELDPNAATPRCLLGVLYDRAGEHGAAQESYEIAARLRPSDYSILNNLAVSFLLAGEPARAVPHLEHAIVLEPRDTALHNNLGLALALSGHDDDALQAFRKAADEPQAHNNLGYARYLRGDYGLAIRSYEKALAVRGEGVLRVIRNLELAREALGEPLEGNAPETLW
jgi:Flp pilus assembly protein TadD